MERQTRLNISKSPCIKSGLDLGCIKCRRRFRVLVKSVVAIGTPQLFDIQNTCGLPEVRREVANGVVVGIMADKGLVLSFVLVGRPYKSI